MDNIKPKTYQKDELSLKELLEYGGAYLHGIKKSWPLITLLTIGLGLASFFYFSNKPTLYKARLSFMLDEDESNSLSSMSSILGQFGIPLMNQRVNISKVLELSKSRKIIQDAIFHNVEIDNNIDLLANHIISIYELDEKWSSNNEEMTDFRFTHTKVDSFNQEENMALKNLAVLIAGTPANRKSALIETDYGKNTTIMSYVTHSVNERVSFHITKLIFKATSDFYVAKAVEKQKMTYDVLRSKRDSLTREYNKLESRYTNLSDRSTGLFSKKTDIKRERARAEMVQLGSGLAKVEENMALVEFGLENSTPILQVIDAPILPLEEVRTSKLKSIMLGLLAGLVLGIGFTIIRTFFRLMSH